MRQATKFRCLNLCRSEKYRPSLVFNSSTLSKARKYSPESCVQKHSKVTKENSSLFNEIVQILGSESHPLDTVPRKLSVVRDTVANEGGNREGVFYCTNSVRGNAQLNREAESEVGAAVGNVHLASLRDDELSYLVNKIANVVWVEDSGGLTMEEQLDQLDIYMDSEVVGNVLKRFFKVARKGVRFFNWVKRKNRSCCTTEVYNTLLYMTGEAKEFQLIEKLMEEMEPSGCKKDIKTWSILIMHYGKANLIGSALLLWEKMRGSGCEPDSKLYELMIRLLCAANKGEIALEFYHEMIPKNMTVSINIYNMLLKCLAAAGDVVQVRFVADDMINISQIPDIDVYSAVLRSFCIAHRISEALEWIRDLNKRNFSFGPEYFEILVKGLCCSGRMDDALEIIEIMKKKGGYNPQVYGSIISGYLRRKEISKALDVFHDMKESGLLPSSSTYTEIMQHLFSLNEYEKGCAIYNEMLERGVEMDNVAFMAMVAGHVRQNHITLAISVFRDMEKKGIRATRKSYSVLIKELCRASRTEEIIRVLNQMQDSEVNIGDEIFNVILSYLKRKREMVKLEEVKEMQRYHRICPPRDDHSSKPTLLLEEPHEEFSNAEPKQEYSSMVPLSKSYKDEDLHEVYKILSSSSDLSSMKGALETRAICYTPELVVEILRKSTIEGRMALDFFSWVGQQNGFSHTAATYNMAIKIAGRGKQFKLMRSLFYEMKRNGCLVTPDTWTIMIMLYGRVGLTGIALQLFTEMRSGACRPDAVTYKYIILSLCSRKGRKVDEAILLFSQMINAGFVPDKELGENYFDCLCQSNKIEEAKRCMHSLRKVGFSTPLRYSLLVRALCRVGKLEEALGLLDEVEEERSMLDHYVCGSIVHGLLQKGRVTEALDKMEAMKQRGTLPTVHVYTSLLVHYLKEKQLDSALGIFRKMWEEHCQPTLVTYSVLLRGYLDLGKSPEAWILFRRMKLKGPFPDFKTYSIFITGLCRVGRSEEAMQLLSEMGQDGIVPSTVNFRTVFFGLNREGKGNLASLVSKQKHELIQKWKTSS